MRILSIVIAVVFLIIEIVLFWDAYSKLQEINSLIGSERAQSELGVLLHFYISIALVLLSLLMIGGVLYRSIRSNQLRREIILLFFLIANILFPIWFWYWR